MPARWRCHSAAVSVPDVGVRAGLLHHRTGARHIELACPDAGKRSGVVVLGASHPSGADRGPRQ
jgi:hypothetical protein